jgi:hypothetical protein
MASLLDRLLNLAVAADEGANALGGGSPRETISGTIGRGLLRGYWWAPPARFVVDWIFGQGHCAAQAAREAARGS